MIEFNGIRSSAVGVIVERYPDRPIPRRKYEKFQVPGRSGDIIAFEDAWDNIVQRYEIYVSAETQGLPIVAAAAARWLQAPGYCRLEDEYDRDVFRRAAFVGPLDLANILNSFGRATIEFDCDPRRFLKSGAQPVAMTNGGKLTSPTGFAALPIIRISGSGAGTLTVGGVTVSLTETDGVTLDCEEQDCTRTVGGVVSNFNSGMTGAFPALGAGVTEISWTGGVTAVEIVPRWWTL